MASLKNILPIFLLTALLLLFTPLLAVAAESEGADSQVYLPPETVEITGEFTDNLFSHIVNGQKNTVKLTFNNKGEQNYTIYLIGGALVNKDNPSEIYRNLTAYKYSLAAPGMDHVEVVYSFYAEFPPQDLDLILYVFFTDKDAKKFRGTGYNGTVTVVDPEVSIFDLQLLFMYLILIGIFGGIGYMIFQTFFGGAKAKKGKKRNVVKTEEGATGSSDKYDESWIPEHHLKPSSTRSSARIKKKNETKKD